MADLTFKYNIGKSSIYSYLSTKEPEARPNSPERQAIKVQIEPLETDDKRKKYIASLHKMKSDDLDLGVIDVVEKLGSRFADLEGLHKDIEVNEQIDEVLKELSCEYDLLSKYTKPEYRLIGLTGFQMFEINMQTYNIDNDRR